MNKARLSRSLLRPLAVLATGSLVLTGCLRTLESEGTLQKFGAIVVRGAPGELSGFNATSTAIFFQAYSASVPNSSNQTNACQVAAVDTVTRIATGQLSAGTALDMRVGLGTSVRSATLDYDLQRQRYETAGFVTYSAGDSVTITIPGNATGFPAGVIRTRLAEPLLVSDVSIPAAGTPMLVRWNASSDPTTAVYLALKYANPANSLYANEQVLCSLSDDGAEDIPANALNAFLASPAAMRSLTVTRWRTNVINPVPNALLHIVSTVDAVAKFK